MKLLKNPLLAAAVLTLLACPAPAQRKAHAGFDRLKTLAGEWEGKAADGKPIRASYKLVSAGTALLETLRPPDESEMITLYHADGSRVAMTHYCNANNQPRMQTAPLTGPVKQLTFSFVGATNLASPVAGHMDSLDVAFDDADHFTQKWTWLADGKKKTEVFHFARKR